VVGNHGLEGVPGWEGLAAEHEASCRIWRTQLDLALARPEFDRGIQLEDKRYSLSVHYRQVEDVDQSARQLSELFAALSPAPRVVAGKCVFNLLAQDACHKGSALQRLIGLCEAAGALYVGDDVTDEDVFRMHRPEVLSVRIEHSAESAADFFLPYPRDILRLLDELIVRLARPGSQNWLAASVANIVNTGG
jgi:trehalose 6-phosphate phosphatase